MMLLDLKWSSFEITENIFSLSHFSFQADFFLLELKNGLLNLQYDFGFKGGPVTLDSTSPKLQINDARYHEVNRRDRLATVKI